MKKSNIFLGIILMFFNISLFSQNAHKEYALLWSKYDSLVNIGLNKSAVNVLEDIQVKSLNAKDYPTYLKSFILRFQIAETYTEDSELEAINTINEKINACDDIVCKSVLHSTLTKYYINYLNRNTYLLRNRKHIVEDTSKDIKLWDEKRIKTQILKHFAQSVENVEVLKNTDINLFDTILIKNVKYRDCRPTMYDLLAHYYIDYMYSEILKKRYTLESEHFGLFDNYAKISLSKDKEQDKLLYDYLDLYQKLTNYHLKQNNKIALIDLDIKRLKHFVKISPEHDSIYTKSLELLKDKFPTEAFSSFVYYELAEYYYNKAEAERKNNNYFILSFNIAHQAILKYRNSDGANNCETLIKKIRNPYLSVVNESVYTSKENIKINVEYRNIDTLFYSIYSEPLFNDLSHSFFGMQDRLSYLKSLNSPQNGYFILKKDGKMNYHSTEIMLPPLAFGNYTVVFSDKRNYNEVKDISISLSDFEVSNIDYLFNNQKQKNIIVLDRISGKPLKDVKINIYEITFDRSKGTRERIKLNTTLTTNKDGFADFEQLISNQYKSYRVLLSKDNDSIMVKTGLELYRSTSNENKYLRSYIYTDKALYTPGEVVNYKGIVVEYYQDTFYIKTNYKGSISMFDVNRKLISKNEYTTNEYGSFAGSFVTSTNILNGQMQITDNIGYASVKVEEYKLPTYDIQFEEISDNYKINDIIKVKGNAKSFTGIPISKAKVTYSITADVPWYIRFKQNARHYTMLHHFHPSSNNNEQIATGEIYTDDHGNFEISFKAINPFNTEALVYKINVTSTDINGETNEGNKIINVSNQPIHIIADIEEKINNAKASYNYGLRVINNNQVVQATDISIKVYSLINENKSHRNRLWDVPDMHIYEEAEYKKLFPFDSYKNENMPEQFKIDKTVKEWKINAFKDSIINLDLFKNIQEGHYKIVIEANSKQNYIAKTELIVMIYSPKSQIPFANQLVNIINTNTSANYKPQDTLEFFVNSFAETFIVQEIFKPNGSYTYKLLPINKSTKSIKYIVDETDRGGISIRLTAIHQNRIFCESFYANVPYENKQLNVSFSNFRNKTQPGTDETFTLTIKDYKNKPVEAEVLICMTDDAVEKIMKNNWSLNLFNKRYQYAEQFNSTSKTSTNLSGYRFNEAFFKPEYDALFFDHFITSDFYNPHYGNLKRNASPAGIMASNTMEMSAKVESSDTQAGKGDAHLDETISDITNNETIRSKFQESVFFYPNLYTNNNGNIEISFRLPDNITKWKITGLAHNKELANSIFENYISTSKPLLITSNLPKFFVENDTIHIIAKISNLTDSSLNYTSILEIKDAINGDMIKDIVLQPNKGIIHSKVNKDTEWKIKIPQDIRAINVKIYAKAGQHTDGEETNIPIISSRVKLTESLPFFANPIENKSYKFSSLDKLNAPKSTAKINKLIVECTPDPVWNVVYALPYLSNNDPNNTFSLLSSFYANLISYKIINKNPEIKTVLNKLYEKQNYAHSNLEKNQDIKDILLSQTPWVNNAEQEKETFLKLKILFNNNNFNNTITNNIDDLQKRQNSDGGFVWYKGMQSDMYITINVLEQLGKIKKYHLLGNKNDINKLNDVATKAIAFADNKVIEQYNNIKKENSIKDMSTILNFYFIDYLYARSFYNEMPLSKQSANITDTIINAMTKQWQNLSYNNKAKIALITYRKNNKLHIDILKSLTENAINNKDIGTYWKNENNIFYNNYFNTHLNILEAFKEIQKDNPLINDIYKWLIINKQANTWGSNINTANAAIMIIDQKPNVLDNKNNVSIIIGNDTINTNNKTINLLEGSSYFRMEYDIKKINKASTDIQIINKGNAYAYGSIYVEYEDEKGKIEEFNKTPLKITKRYFLEKEGNSLKQIENMQRLKMGDKVIVRIDISSDREMEYVMINDIKSPIITQNIQLSGYKYNNGLYYYQTNNKFSNLFFINKIYKGQYSIDIPLFVTGKGTSNVGLGTIQSLYAPEFRANTQSFILKAE